MTSTCWRELKVAQKLFKDHQNAPSSPLTTIGSVGKGLQGRGYNPQANYRPSAPPLDPPNRLGWRSSEHLRQAGNPKQEVVPAATFTEEPLPFLFFPRKGVKTGRERAEKQQEGNIRGNYGGYFWKTSILRRWREQGGWQLGGGRREGREVKLSKTRSGNRAGTRAGIWHVPAYRAQERPDSHQEYSLVSRHQTGLNPVKLNQTVVGEEQRLQERDERERAGGGGGGGGQRTR